ncbi:MAG: heme-binding protein [Pseudomonadota bacterium]
MRLHTSLPLEKANAIITTALVRGRAANLLPLTVVVLDAGGKMVAMQSEDGSGLVRFEIAFGKAYGALGMGISSRLIRDRLSNRPAFQGAIATASGGQFIPVPGGVLIEAQGTTLGAVGISGDTSDKDEYCAIEAIREAGYASEPAEPNPEWRTSSLSDHYPASP